MNLKPLNELDYNLEIEKIVKTAKKEKSKKILLQFPDGLKPYSTQVVKELKDKLNKTEILIWMDSCFGACDIPIEAERLGVDLIVQFGHSAWDFKDKKRIRILS
jgi:2-(3-amino-3-carboxypropyl)histidine synthase